MPKTQEQLIAEFLAKKGATKIAVGESNNVSNGMWYKASQGEVDLNAKLENGPLAPKKARVAKPAREGERFFHSDWKRSS